MVGCIIGRSNGVCKYIYIIINVMSFLGFFTGENEKIEEMESLVTREHIEKP